jgi:porin
VFVIGFIRMAARGLVVGVLVIVCAPARAEAQAPTPPTPPPLQTTPSDVWTRPGLTGDWGGPRKKMEDGGTKLNVSFTQFFSWVPTIQDTTEYQYGNKLDVMVRSDLSKIAWKGLSVDGHLEMRSGKAPQLSGGTLIPTNTALLLPEAEGTTWRLSNVTFTQVLNPHVVLSAGRFNIVDIYNKAYTGGRGIDKFMNLSFTAPPLDIRTIPPVVEGVSFTILRGGEVAATAGLIESTDEGFFANGATVLWSVAVPLKPSRMPGHYSVGGAFSSVVASSLDQSPWAFLPPLNIFKAKEQGAWTVNFTFDQALFEDATTPSKNWGLFGLFGVSDSNPSPFQPFLYFGAGGNVLIVHRTNDTFGIGYFYGGLSNDLIQTVQPFLRLRDEQGAELYYNLALTGWTSVTADLQFVDPFAVGSKTRTFFSVRWKIAF